jgi:outer membrane receptor protein involved in Fe transport
MYRTVRSFLLSVLLVLVCVLSVTLPALAQSGATAASLTGTVTDEQGAIIPGAIVTARNMQTNFTREIQVGEADGSFLLPQLPPGTYELTVTAEGFTTKTSKIDLVLGATTALSFAMSIGANTEVIEVKATGSIDQNKTESSTNVDKDRIDGLPINRRDFMEFSLTVARVVKDGLPQQGAIATSGLSFNGQSARFNNITIDGLDNNDPATGSARATFGQDAVQEFQVITDNYSAEFGRAVGGVVNIVTKGGGNDFHGSLFFFDRNDKISARDVFAPFRPPYKQYQFGGTFSGPIKKDRAFFFTSFERLSVKQNNFVTISDDTAAAARRQGFAFNTGPVPFALDTTTFLSRFDAKLSTNNNFYARFSGGGTYNGNFDPFGGLIADTEAGIQLLSDGSLVFSNTYINPGLNLVNETRFLFGKREQDVTSSIPGPQIQLFAPEGLVKFGLSVFPPQSRNQTIYQIVDNVSLSRGRHQIKFGADYLYNNSPREKTTLCFFCEGLGVFTPLDFGTLLGNPSFPFFSGLQAFDANLRTPEQRVFLTGLANILSTTIPGYPKLPLADLSLPFAYLQVLADTRVTFREQAFALFVQDDVKVRPNLLLKGGLRYDLNRLSSFPNNSGNFSPRVSFAYRPEWEQKLAIRGGYGLFFGVQSGVFAAAINNTTDPNHFLVIPFPFSVVPLATPERHFPSGPELPTSVPFIPQLVPLFRFQPDLRNGYSQQTDIGIDYAVNDNLTIAASYIYVRGIKVYGLRNINPVVRIIPGDPLGSIITGRVNPSIGEYQEFESSFDSYYHALTVGARARIPGKANLLVHYTFSKAIDNTDDFNPLNQVSDNPLRPDLERGLSLQDLRGRFVFTGLFYLNYSQNRFLKDYQVSTILNLNTGRPYNLLAGVDLNQNGDSPPGDRPRIGGVPIGRNAGIRPGFASMDLRLTRTVTMGERFKLQGFLEIFNLFNRVNISEIDGLYLPDSTGQFNLPERQGSRFGTPSERFRNALSPRQFQLGFRLNF